MNPEKSIPAAVLKGARGLAILTVAKAGVLLAYKLGTGLVVARRSDGSWSAPSAILSAGLGWGAQVCFIVSSLEIRIFIHTFFYDLAIYLKAGTEIDPLRVLILSYF